MSIIASYIGPRGYSVNKTDLTPQQMRQIRADLTVRPFVPGSPVIGTMQTFPAYRESPNKIYLPRHYGESTFGRTTASTLPPGEHINVAFVGELRDPQVPVVAAVMSDQGSGGSGGLIELPCGFGKTTIGLNLVSRIGLKTVVIVHKEFLMDQWIESIGKFLPGARVGKIQGPTVDVEDKDIVLAMLQSVCKKEYPPGTWNSFGLTIIDEVHHISSETFSNTLFTLVTKYMIGLSATMTRKDGTTKIFKMFLGDVLYKAKRAVGEHQVVVKAIQYVPPQQGAEDFSTVVYDARGNPQFSTMISKLCGYTRRSEFIIQVLTHMLQENPRQQVMILAHNKNLLIYLYDAIESRGIASVGYYIGGMKKEALKTSEQKTVIIATYAMAAEGLDIKSLTTLIMATPKTDIEQSVGRILREKHAKPVVVDITDVHDLFRKQWYKRNAWYKKQGYTVLSTTSVRYPHFDGVLPVEEDEDEDDKPSKCLIRLPIKAYI